MPKVVNQNQMRHGVANLHLTLPNIANQLKAVSEKDVIKFCRENIKVEVLKRGEGKSSIV